jgi:L-ascorbate metabolism protein UlaG (beta-lactamase superfamily)
MEITWFGHSCFRLRDRDVRVITDPFDESLGYALPSTQADIVTVSHDHPHHNCVQAVKGEYKVIDSPGEYEIRSVFITGIATYPPRHRQASEVAVAPPLALVCVPPLGGKTGDYRCLRKGAEARRNTIFVFEFGGVTVCHLGDLSHIPPQEQVQALSTVDVLMVPVGGGEDCLSAAQAVEIVGMIEPSLVIPMHYNHVSVPSGTDAVSMEMDRVDRFLKEMGVGRVEPMSVLKVTESTLPQETQVVVLSPQNP